MTKSIYKTVNLLLFMVVPLILSLTNLGGIFTFLIPMLGISLFYILTSHELLVRTKMLKHLEKVKYLVKLKSDQNRLGRFVDSVANTLTLLFIMYTVITILVSIFSLSGFYILSGIVALIFTTYFIGLSIYNKK